MPPPDLLRVSSSGLLFLAGFGYSLVMIYRRLGKKEPYAFWAALRDAASPAGMALLGLRTLLIELRYLSPGSPGSRWLAICATLGIVGGIAASRIRRRPG